MRALSHPIRFRLIELLREGPSTASRLARRLGESSGATSYHLRVLERAEVVEEDASLGTARERWWKRRDRMLLMPTEYEDAEGRAIAARMRAFMLNRDEEVARRFQTGEAELDLEWRRAAFVGSWNVDLTPAEADELSRRIVLLVDEYREPRERSADTRRVGVTFRALPWVE
jgi:DNA-binding transcriptional ArsR family regulator